MTEPNLIPIQVPIPAAGGFSDDVHRGIASLTHNGRILRFRTNPNSIWWTYKLNTVEEQTYGGRVVQILSTSIEDLVIKVDCGRGGWPYLTQVVNFLKQMMIDQRQRGGITGEFSYTTRNWRMKVFALTVPFQDQVAATTRELELRFKVAEDVSGVMSQIALSSEINRIQDGMGFRKSRFNDPNLAGQSDPTAEQAPGTLPSDFIGAGLDILSSGLTVPAGFSLGDWGVTNPVGMPSSAIANNNQGGSE